MNINDILRTDEIKVSKHSWTVKRNGKTVGVIRNITSFPVVNNEQASKAFEFHRKIKGFSNHAARINTAGFYWNNAGEIFYLYNVNEENFYTNQLNQFGKPLSPDDYERFVFRKNAVEELGKSVTVVSAIVI